MKMLQSYFQLSKLLAHIVQIFWCIYFLDSHDMLVWCRNMRWRWCITIMISLHVRFPIISLYFLLVNNLLVLYNLGLFSVSFYDSVLFTDNFHVVIWSFSAHSTFGHVITNNTEGQKRRLWKWIFLLKLHTLLVKVQ